MTLSALPARADLPPEPLADLLRGRDTKVHTFTFRTMSPLHEAGHLSAAKQQMNRMCEKGCQSMCLDVAATTGAVAFYQPPGFEGETETRVPHLAETQGTGLHHLVQALEPLA